jgi:hypothetical protein
MSRVSIKIKLMLSKESRHYQLCREEMLIACKDNHAQRQLMNIMVMVKLKRHGEDNSTQPPQPYERLGIFFLFGLVKYNCN